MSVSLGGEPTFTDTPYRLRLDIPEGTPALWIGRDSKYPHQNELLLPANVEYHLNRAEKVGTEGPLEIFAELMRVHDPSE